MHHSQNDSPSLNPNFEKNNLMHVWLYGKGIFFSGQLKLEPQAYKQEILSALTHLLTKVIDKDFHAILNSKRFPDLQNSNI